MLFNSWRIFMECVYRNTTFVLLHLGVCPRDGGRSGVYVRCADGDSVTRSLGLLHELIKETFYGLNNSEC